MTLILNVITIISKCFMKDNHLIIAIIENLSLDPNTSFDFFDWTITNNPVLIKEVIPNEEAFIHLVGSIFYDCIYNQPVAFKFCETNIGENISIVLHNEAGKINSVLSLLWIYFDNSIFSSIQFSQNVKEYGMCSNRRDSFISNSYGIYIKTHLQSESIKKISGYSLFDTANELYHSAEVSKEELTSNGIRAGLEDHMVNFNRLQRAHLLLSICRSTSLLPMKIAFYINVLECLLLSTESELNYRLQIYVANLIGEDKSEKEKIGSHIKLSYSVRSKFIHGAKIKHSYDELKQLSSQLDELTRKVFVKSFNIKNIINSKNSRDLDEYMNSITFS